jgi:hypothetical protein
MSEYCSACEERFAEVLLGDQRVCLSCFADWQGATGYTLDDSYTSRHLHCVRLADQIRAYGRSPGVTVSEVDGKWLYSYPSGETGEIRGYCDHPEDFFCTVDAPTSDQLARVFGQLEPV